MRHTRVEDQSIEGFHRGRRQARSQSLGQPRRRFLTISATASLGPPPKMPLRTMRFVGPDSLAGHRVDETC